MHTKKVVLVIVMFMAMFLLAIGGCYNQDDVVAGIKAYQDIVAHDFNPHYVYTNYAELWPIVEDSAGLYMRIKYNGSGVVPSIDEQAFIKNLEGSKDGM